MEEAADSLEKAGIKAKDRQKIAPIIHRVHMEKVRNVCCDIVAELSQNIPILQQIIESPDRGIFGN